ncbi:MAG TPA: CHAD domain-containing protein [Solirubrobacteraceae bacterium]|jgi:CHAD domain-containing protein|nr:CHAD domain-containing protein [Solirubrobacteraceae bacterium]
MARAQPIPDLDCGDAFATAAAKVVATRAAELFELRSGVLDVDDVERLHDMRVATRRLRAVLEIFAPCFPRRLHRTVLRDVKRLADALGARRDPDVQIGALTGYVTAAPPSDHAGVEVLIARLRREQGAANAALSQALAEADRSDLRGRLHALVQEARR